MTFRVAAIVMFLVMTPNLFLAHPQTGLSSASKGHVNLETSGLNSPSKGHVNLETSGLSSASNGHINLETSGLNSPSKGHVNLETSGLNSPSNGHVNLDASGLNSSSNGHVNLETSGLSSASNGHVNLDASGQPFEVKVHRNIRSLPVVAGAGRSLYACYSVPINGGVVVLPKGEVRLAVGEQLDVACMVDPDMDLHAKDFNFTLDGHTFPQVQDDYTINATLTFAQPGEHKVICTNGEKTCYRTIQVGYPPQDVQDLSCVSRNLRVLECRWTVVDNPVQTPSEDYKVTLTDLDTNTHIGLEVEGCNLDGKHQCSTWNTTMGYSPLLPDLQINVLCSNMLGQGTFVHDISNFEVVLPAAPLDVVAVEVSPLAVEVTWTSPPPLQEFPPGLSYCLHLQPLQPSDTTSAQVLVGRYGPAGSWRARLTPPYPGVVYQIRLKLRSGARNYSTIGQCDDTWWSPSTNTTVVTRPTVPWTAPAVGRGTYQLRDDGEVRELTVMWRPLEPLLHNGPNLIYLLTCADASNITHQTKETSGGNITFNGLSLNTAYSVTIKAVNAIGEGNVTARLEVASALPAAPILPVVVWHRGNDMYELRWSGGVNLTYSVYVCTDGLQTKDPCQSELYWLDVGTESAVNVSLSEMNVIGDTSRVRFAVSAEDTTSSSGMSWDRCGAPLAYTPRRTPPTIKEPSVEDTVVVISWDLTCEDKSSVVEDVEVITEVPGVTVVKNVYADEVLLTADWLKDTKYTVVLRLHYRSGYSSPVSVSFSIPHQGNGGMKVWVIVCTAMGSVLVVAVLMVLLVWATRRLKETHKGMTRPINLPQGLQQGGTLDAEDTMIYMARQGGPVPTALTTIFRSFDTHTEVSWPEAPPPDLHDAVIKSLLKFPPEYLDDDTIFRTSPSSTTSKANIGTTCTTSKTPPPTDYVKLMSVERTCGGGVTERSLDSLLSSHTRVSPINPS